ncbi:MAG: hypothetical protein AAF567_22170 [Actinomycetota bacterium]
MRSTTEETSQFDRSVRDAYLREFGPALAGYIVTLSAVLVFVDFETAGWWKYPAALIPVIPCLWGVRAVARHIGRIDEMQRDRLLSALGVGFGAAMAAAITLGLLGTMATLDTTRWGPWVIYGLGMGSWGIAGMRNSAWQ